MHPLFWVAGILLFTGAAVAAAIVAAVIVGFWLFSYAVSTPVRHRLHRPTRSRDPWRALDGRAVTAEKRYAAAARNAPAGPLRQRLRDLQGRVESSTKDARRMAGRGRELETLVRDGDPDGATARELLADLRNGLAQRVDALEATASVAVELTIRAELDRVNGDAADIAAQLEALVAALDTVEAADHT